MLESVVPPGSAVKRGQTVASFDRQFMLVRLDDYKASVIQSQANFRKQMADLDISRKAHDQLVASAKADVDKAELDMKTIPVRSAIDSERLRLALEEAQARYKQLLAEVPFVRAGEDAQVRISELDLKQSELELKRVQANVDRMSMKARMDGLAVMQSTFRGAEFGQIQAGDQLYPGQPFMQIVDARSMVVNASVNQVDAEQLRIGAKATVRFDAYPNLSLPAHVDAIGAITKPGLFRANYVKEVPVRLKLDGLDPRVIPDLTVSAEVTISTAPAGPVVPLGAVQKDGASGQPFVYVQQADTWERRPVELGLVNHLVAAVRKGLASGDIVALERPPAEASLAPSSPQPSAAP